jgi:hypothetical protein
MRLYIRSRVKGPCCPEYEFVRASEGALFWDAKDRAEQVCSLIAQEGITIANPLYAGQPCSDFRVEPRPSAASSSTARLRLRNSLHSPGRRTQHTSRTSPPYFRVECENRAQGNFRR